MVIGQTRDCIVQSPDHRWGTTTLPPRETLRLAPAPIVTINQPLYVHVARVVTARQMDLDVHQALEVIVVTRGTMERQFGPLCYDVGPGDVVLCAAWEPHGWRVACPEVDVVTVLFLPDLIDGPLGAAPWLRLFAAPPADRHSANSPRSRKVALAAAREIAAESREQRPDWRHAVWLAVLRLLLELSRGWRPSGAAPGSPTGASPFDRIAPAVALVHGNPMRVVSVAQAAAACRLSVSHFSALFGKTMGLGFATFCRRVRLTAAARLLLSTNLPLERIAAETGFVDASHLHRSFVKYYGVMPMAYRSQSR
jgi:AraC-like DNA-binding protein